jgi:hypothetical protein
VSVEADCNPVELMPELHFLQHLKESRKRQIKQAQNVYALSVP